MGSIFNRAEEKRGRTLKRKNVCVEVRNFSFFYFSFGLLILLLSFFSTIEETRATTSLPTSSCPLHFIGVVKSVTDSSAPFSMKSYLPKIEVIFSVSRVVSDPQKKIGDSFTLKIVKGTHLKFSEGEKYEVYAQESYLCRAEKVHK